VSGEEMMGSPQEEQEGPDSSLAKTPREFRSLSLQCSRPVADRESIASRVVHKLVNVEPGSREHCNQSRHVHVCGGARPEVLAHECPERAARRVRKEVCIYARTAREVL